MVAMLRPAPMLVTVSDTEACAFGQRLRRYRDLRRLTQLQLSDLAAISRAYVAQMERGDGIPHITVVNRLAAALDITPAELLGYHEPRPTAMDTAARALEEVLTAIRGVPLQVVGRVSAEGPRWTAFEEGRSVHVLQEDIDGLREPFGVEVIGDCLLECGIINGDVAICETADSGYHPHDGEIVFIRIGDAKTLKRWFRTATGAELRDGRDRVVCSLGADDDVQILGVYITIRRRRRRVR